MFFGSSRNLSSAGRRKIKKYNMDNFKFDTFVDNYYCTSFSKKYSFTFYSTFYKRNYKYKVLSHGGGGGLINIPPISGGAPP